MENPHNAAPGHAMSLSSQTYEVLKRRIVRLRLAPGQWVTERAVAAELGSGLAPVRSAMARLSNEGLLVTVPRRGYRVRGFTRADCDELFAAWRVIALEIMRLATSAMTEETLRGYRELLPHVRAGHAGEDDEVEVLLDLATEQWRYLARLAGNRYLEDALLRLETQISRLCAFGLSSSDLGPLEMSFRREAEIIGVFDRRDVAAAIDLTDALMTRIQHDIRAAFDRGVPELRESEVDARTAIKL